MIKALRRLYNSVTKKERKVVLENFFSLSTLQGITYILPVFVLPYLIRVLGPERFGLIAFAQAFIQYFLILTDYGFNVTATRQIALCRQKQDKVCEIFSSVITIKVILAVASLGVMALILRFVPRFAQDWQVYCLSFGVVIGNTLFPVWFYQGTEKMRYIAILNVIAGFLFLAGVFIFVRKASDYLIVPFLQSMISLVVGVIAFSLAFRKFNISYILQTYPDIKQQVKDGWNVFSSIVAINSYTATRIFALGLLTNNVLTGYYTIAERIAAAIQAFPLLSFSQAVFPRISHIFKRSKKRAFQLMTKMQYVATQGFILSLPIIFIAAPWIIRIVTGHRYEVATASLRLLLLAVFFVGANAFRVQFLLVSGRAKSYATIHITMALIGLPLIFLWTYFFSYLGAAIVGVFIEGGIFVLTSESLNDLREQYT
ncbi:MAG: flippase [Candidatus Omnitrophica bacterium]|nr:flippase [Candidatus Omnitrophota bacterium]